ncbi:MAG: 16S rRNA (cytidine(1402)-2'-O)-methyltransferase [Alphaproteobacteria bacterium]|nr:16S rRNA (cytidine(1402)-2'-O)-methyltransferase [Alphaproteobacteria bacterium]
MLRNGLYIIATPIGNLRDISSRAVETLCDADIIACEDSRVSKKLFSLLGIGINKKFISYEDHSEEQKAQMIIDFINQGNSVALISDAGSPLISDPGYKLVRLCRKQGIYITAIPGACAVITALQLSGLPTNRFMFAGFIPNKDKARGDLFEELKNINTTLVFYETAPRLLKTLARALEIFGNREISIARELTKMYEEVICGSFTEAINHFAQNEPRGEFVLIIAPAQEKQSSVIDIKEILRKRLGETSLKTAVKEISEEYKLAKNDVYSMALELKNEQLP